MSTADPTPLPAVHAAGGVVYSYTPGGELVLAIVLDRRKNWGLPKGHREHGESDVETARREIAEEVGVACEIGDLIDRVEYVVPKQSGLRQKIVSYFLAPTTYQPLTPQTDEGISEARWVTPTEALHTLTYPSVRQVVQQALTKIAPQSPSSSSSSPSE